MEYGTVEYYEKKIRKWLTIMQKESMWYLQDDGKYHVVHYVKGNEMYISRCKKEFRFDDDTLIVCSADEPFETEKCVHCLKRFYETEIYQYTSYHELTFTVGEEKKFIDEFIEVYGIDEFSTLVDIAIRHVKDNVKLPEKNYSIFIESKK